MKGQILGISGPTVTVDAAGIKLYDRVALGEARLMGEAVRMERDTSIVQVYEDTRGLAVGEPAENLAMPLSVRLGPGLLDQIFDGLQRPLRQLGETYGPFILAGKELPPVGCDRQWRFVPVKKGGDVLKKGEAIGTVEEGAFQHHIIPMAMEGTIDHIVEGDICPDDAVATLTDGRKIYSYHHWPVRSPRPYGKKLVAQEPLVTGQRCIDFFFPQVRGGTAIFPGGFGTGKTVLEQSITKFAETDIVVYVGCGERGNEMAEMLEEFGTLSDPWSGNPLTARTVMVVNTSNMPVAAREASIYTAVTMAEYYRDMGYNVLFLADSISRWAEALREISSALEEMPGEEGYPTYLSSRLSRFFARAGVVETLSGQTGSLSMILSVSPPGGDFTEPVTQACLRNTGSFLMLDTGLAHRRHFPAINWSQSFSLYEETVSSFFDEKIAPEWTALKKECKGLLQREEKLREVAEIVGAEGLEDEGHLLMHVAQRVRQEFLCQNAYTEDAFSPPDKTFAAIKGILDFYHEAQERLGQGQPLGEILQEGQS
ncbi:MAG: V-type ATP synthase subunit A [bacterium]|nr:V-type ATP synthase subunit A [bacterium]